MWNFDSSKPVYLQLVEQITRKIIIGEYPSGEKMPTVRSLATEAKVNPNTVQKVFSLLEQSGIVVTDRTIGRYVTEDKEMIKKMGKAIAKDLCRDFIRDMKSLGYEVEEVEAILKEEYNREKI